MTHAPVRQGVAPAVAATVALAAALLLPAPPAHAAQPRDYGVTAHRGEAGPRVTENTLAALRAARRAGATALEFDVALTADHRYVLMHDATLDRTTTCEGPVGDRTLRWIRQRCRGQAGGERIPSLRHALAWADGRAVNLAVELKAHGPHRWRPADLTAVHRMLRRRGLAHRTTLSSFSERVVRVAEDTGDLRTAAIVTSWRDARGAPARADVVSIRLRLLDRARVAALHRRGDDVWTFPVNGPRTWERAHRLAVDGIVTDRVRAYRSWRRGR